MFNFFRSTFYYLSSLADDDDDFFEISARALWEKKLKSFFEGTRIRGRTVFLWNNFGKFFFIRSQLMLMIIVNNGKVLEESLVCLFFPADISLGRIIIIMIKPARHF